MGARSEKTTPKTGKILAERKSKLRKQIRIARQLWGGLSPLALQRLGELLMQYDFSVASGDVIYLQANWYVTHAGLLRLAQKNGCFGIEVIPVAKFSNPSTSRWAFRATVYKSRVCCGFVGYGDADPSNVSPLVRGAEMRVAETRAVNRALRKAYGIGICSVEEIGSLPTATEKRPPQKENGNGNRNENGSVKDNGNAAPKLRDRLCQLIRQHQLDPELVKAYAIDLCGVKTLRDATRSQLEHFIQQLADWAEKDRNALLCQLNSYALPTSKEQIA